MHILDRSHIKYPLQLDNSFTIDSDSAKKRIRTLVKVMGVMGP